MKPRILNTRFWYTHIPQFIGDPYRTHFFDLYADMNRLSSDPEFYHVPEAGLTGPQSYCRGCRSWVSHINCRLEPKFVHVIRFVRNEYAASKGANAFEGFHESCLDLETNVWNPTRLPYPHWCDVVELDEKCRPPLPPSKYRVWI